MGDVEALALDGRVGVEGHVQSVAGRHDRVRQTAAAQSGQLARARVRPVEDLQPVVRALHVRLQFEVVERLHAGVVAVRVEHTHTVTHTHTHTHT